jgi:uncharacterized protein YdcH (DUF465 family)
LTADEVTFTVTCEEEYERIEGNASSIDEETDRSIAQSIRSQLARGNQWAWCCVRVEASGEDFKGDAYLGCCSYESERDFCASGGHFDDMKIEALDALNAEIARLAHHLNRLDDDQIAALETLDEREPPGAVVERMYRTECRRRDDLGMVKR